MFLCLVSSFPLPLSNALIKNPPHSLLFSQFLCVGWHGLAFQRCGVDKTYLCLWNFWTPFCWWHHQMDWWINHCGGLWYDTNKTTSMRAVPVPSQLQGFNDNFNLTFCIKTCKNPLEVCGYRLPLQCVSICVVSAHAENTAISKSQRREETPGIFISYSLCVPESVFFLFCLGGFVYICSFLLLEEREGSRVVVSRGLWRGSWPEPGPSISRAGGMVGGKWELVPTSVSAEGKDPDRLEHLQFAFQQGSVLQRRACWLIRIDPWTGQMALSWSTSGVASSPSLPVVTVAM